MHVTFTLSVDFRCALTFLKVNSSPVPNIYLIPQGAEISYMRSILLTLPVIILPTYFMVLVVYHDLLNQGFSGR